MSGPCPSPRGRRCHHPTPDHQPGTLEPQPLPDRPDCESADPESTSVNSAVPGSRPHLIWGLRTTAEFSHTGSRAAAARRAAAAALRRSARPSLHGGASAATHRTAAASSLTRLTFAITKQCWARGEPSPAYLPQPTTKRPAPSPVNRLWFRPNELPVVVAGGFDARPERQAGAAHDVFLVTGAAHPRAPMAGFGQFGMNALGGGGVLHGGGPVRECRRNQPKGVPGRTHPRNGQAVSTLPGATRQLSPGPGGIPKE